MVKAGHIVPLDTCIKENPEFRNIRPEAMNSATYDGHIWAVPMDAGVFTLFYNKAALRKLGWDETRIDALPTDIKAGRFSFDDLRATAKEAIRQGIVEPGFGYWPSLDRSMSFLTLYSAVGGRFSGIAAADTR